MRKNKKPKKSKRSKGLGEIRKPKVKKVKQSKEVIKDCSICQHYIIVGPYQRTCMFAQELYNCTRFRVRKDS